MKLESADAVSIAAMGCFLVIAVVIMVCMTISDGREHELAIQMLQHTNTTMQQTK